jgi:hypothetical protein
VRGILDPDYNVIIRSFDQFPFGTGFEQINANILLKLPDDVLINTCKTDKYMSLVCASNEFWRIKLGILLNLDIKTEFPSAIINNFILCLNIVDPLYSMPFLFVMCKYLTNTLNNIRCQ